MIDEFIKKYQGKIKGYPTDDQFFGECLSSVKLYIKEVFGIDPPPSGANAAYGYWTNFPDPLPEIFEKTQTPKRGDIAIWGTGVGKSGHIAIFLEKTPNGFNSFDQNWGAKWGHIQSHNFSNILGYLTPKGGSMDCKQCIEEQVIDDHRSYLYDRVGDKQHVFVYTEITGRWNFNKSPMTLKTNTTTPHLLAEQLEKTQKANGEWKIKYELLQDTCSKEITELKEALEDKDAQYIILDETLNKMQDDLNREILYWKGEYEKINKDLKACKNAPVDQGKTNWFKELVNTILGFFKKNK